MRILVSRAAFEHFGDRLVAAAPDASFVHPDGDPSAVDVAWLSVDVLLGPDRDLWFATIAAAPALAWVHTAAAGVDGRAFQELLARGVRLSTSHVNSIPIAEYVVRSVLDRFQRTDLWRAARDERAWRHHDFREVYGTTWLVVGLGAIGAAVATRARAFGAHVIGVRRHPTGDEPVDEMITTAALDATVGRADVVVLAAPANAETAHLVDAAFLGRMRSGSVLVNVARGALVDEGALVAALKTGVPEWAVLDVTASEPLPADSPLWSHPRIELTPHSSAGGLGRVARGADAFAANLARFGRGEPLLHEVVTGDGR